MRIAKTASPLVGIKHAEFQEDEKNFYKWMMLTRVLRLRNKK